MFKSIDGIFCNVNSIVTEFYKAIVLQINEILGEKEVHDGGT